jgi:hypothetical protein
MTDQQIMAALLSYRGDHPILSTIAHGMRLGLDMITPEDEARFEALALASAQGERHALIMRERAQVIALSIEKVTAPEPEKIHASEATKRRFGAPPAIRAGKVTRERETDPTAEHFASV